MRVALKALSDEQCTNIVTGAEFIHWRKEDRREWETASGLPVGEALSAAFTASVAKAQLCLKEDDSLLGLVGRGELERDGKTFGTVWFIGTELMLDHMPAMFGWASLLIEEMLRDTDGLVILIDSRNQSHVRWLEYMGFNRLLMEQSMIRGVEFYTYTKGF